MTTVIAWAVLVVSLVAQSKPYIPDEQVTYVCAIRTQAYAEPELSAPVVNVFEPMGIVIVKGAAGGWMYVEPGSVADAKSQVAGWIKANKEDIVQASVLAVVTRRSGSEEKGWPASVRLDIMRGRVRIGFTKQQVEMSYKETPSGGPKPRKHSEETAAGVIETWAYEDAVYTFSKAGRVAKIAKVE